MKRRKRRYIEGLQPLHLYPMTVVRVMVKHGQVWAENKKIAEEKVRRSFKEYGFQMKGWDWGDRVHIGKRFPKSLPDGYKVGKSTTAALKTRR